MPAQKKVGVMERMAQNIGILKRAAETGDSNSSLRAAHKPSTWDKSREPMSERQFVRAFGDKAVHYRLSNRADFVGLLVAGKNCGIMITMDGAGQRKVRLLDILYDPMHIHGQVKVTQRYLRVRDNSSVSALQKGLLKYVA